MRDTPVPTPQELRSRLKGVRQQLKRARAECPSPDTIHELRVSTRRATAAIQSLSEFLPNQPVDSCLSTLKKVRHLAGDVRDLDILLSRYDFAPDDPAQPVTASQLQDLRKYLHRRRRKLAQRLRAYRLQPRQAKQQKSLPHKFRWRGAGDEPDPEKHARSTIGQCARQSLQRLDLWPADPPSLHELRLSLKRLRYCVEFFRDWISTTEFDPVHQRLKRLQVELGAISDGRAMLQILERLQRRCPKKHADVVAALHQHEQEKLTRTCQKFFAKWTDDHRQELRTMLSSLADPVAPSARSIRNEAG